MSEIVTTILAIAVAAQVAIMAKAGKDILNSGLKQSMYGILEASGTQPAGINGGTGGSAELESETETDYTYTDDQSSDHKDDESETEGFEANAEIKSSLRLSL